MITIFLRFVEIRTKIASIIPYFIGMLIYIYLFDASINWFTAILFFIALLFLDMSTTALNNYVSLTKELKKNEQDEYFVAQILNGKMTKNKYKFILIFMIIVGISLSFILVYYTNLLLLLVGCICSLIAITYSYGPLPLFKTPLGEIVSGGADGILIPILFILTQTNDIGITFGSNFITLDTYFLISLALMLLPIYFPIANIMLTNNLCDMENDLANKRYTLPVVTGEKFGLQLLNCGYITSYLLIIIMSIIGILPLVFLVFIITSIPVYLNTKKINEVLDKEKTFKYSLINFLIMSISYALLFLITVLF